MKPRIGIIPGDPSGIGPELIAKLLSEPETIDKASILLIGDRHVFELGQQQADAPFSMEPCDVRNSDWSALPHFAWHPTETISPNEVELAVATEAGGRSVLKTLDLALEFVQQGHIDAIMFAPFNKEAMHKAGLGHDDELHYMAEKLGAEGYISELNTLDGIWTSRVTSHIALKDVVANICEARVCQAVDLIDRTLKRAGLNRPRISVAAINPHAGDGGNFGTEEITILNPAIESCRKRQINVDGPWPSDTVFLKARDGELDAVVTMYHDQGQIAVKLMGFDKGVTVQGGLPYPVTTPAHGTAFDITGQNNANVGATRAAFDIACKMVTHWEKAL